jgi:hypothetical protein
LSRNLRCNDISQARERPQVDLRGDVVEVGFGAGLDVLPPDVAANDERRLLSDNIAI